MYRLLIVEDEDIIRAGIKKIIHEMDLGFSSILEASSGRQALEIASAQEVHVLMTDIRMGDGDGLELISDLVQAGIRCKTIILSGYGQFSYAQQAISLGVGEYLLKPIKKKSLHDALTKLIEQLDSERLSRPSQEMTETRRSSYDNHSITHIVEFLERHYDQDITLRSAAEQIFMNPSYFSSLFKKKTGVNFVRYLQKLRIEKSKKLLLDPKYKIYEIATKIGFSDEKYFFKVFKSVTGITPNEYRDNKERA
ncbi:hypothetical protein B1A99_29470 [Cohnella sp. CIP 111063]|jgi:Response regulator containing CheY-like receiver domain and AraC-type DNA-binding domain|uniref:response regulator transcription factor n=1 Tax=unclassified Cohnella TaxID=2636738 RepID=UPI000B8C4256|nr:MULTISPECIES: response regulator [unclassified Cohnella]OXS53506.1 hypothetical protein B1A99_29470 [Cohnella sp. CIP 111063]PRX61524.1 AraC family two component transcriptional regulator [Cohnella sp. SGD-V74]